VARLVIRHNETYLPFTNFGKVLVLILPRELLAHASAYVLEPKITKLAFCLLIETIFGSSNEDLPEYEPHYLSPGVPFNIYPVNDEKDIDITNVNVSDA
jgi:hypothetical protein